jgi:hypothetical protein
MAQENANILHAAIAFRPIPGPNATTDIEIVAATGIELGSVRRVAGLGPANQCLEVVLTRGLGDPDLIYAAANGPQNIAAQPEPNPPVNLTPSTSPINVVRAFGDPDLRTFWIFFPGAGPCAGAVSWWSIPPIDPIVLPLPPP